MSTREFGSEHVETGQSVGLKEVERVFLNHRLVAVGSEIDAGQHDFVFEACVVVCVNPRISESVNLFNTLQGIGLHVPGVTSCGCLGATPCLQAPNKVENGSVRFTINMVET